MYKFKFFGDNFLNMRNLKLKVYNKNYKFKTCDNVNEFMKTIKMNKI